MEQAGAEIKLNDNFRFYVFGIPEIIMVRANNFRASKEKKILNYQDLLWGSYDLFVFYKRPGNQDGPGKNCRVKTYSRSFSCFLDSGPEESPAKKETYTWEPSCRYEVATAHLAFFKKMGLIPCRVTITVEGRIKQESLPATGALRTGGNRYQEGEEEPEETGLEREFFGSWDTGDFTGRAKRVSEKDPGLPLAGPPKTSLPPAEDFITHEKREKPQGRVPLPDPAYYRKYRVFYDIFFRGRINKD